LGRFLHVGFLHVDIVRRRYKVARLTPIARQAAAVPTSEASVSVAFISLPLSRRASSAECSTSRRLFLNVDNQFRLAKFFRQTQILTLQSGQLIG
jgi:hypothetical protein